MTAVSDSNSFGDERLGQHDEQALLARMRDGDTVALELFVRRFAKILIRYATAQSGMPVVAEEIVQDVFASFWMQRATLVVTHSVKAYLFRAVHHRLANHYRSHHRRSRYIVGGESSNEVDAGGVTIRGSADDEVNAEDLQRAYLRALDQLPPRPREVFLLVRAQGLSYREVSHALDISVRTVEEHMGRALALFRRHLRDWIV